jgi:hypothetical protein
VVFGGGYGFSELGRSSRSVEKPEELPTLVIKEIITVQV